MLDINLIRKETEKVREGLARKGCRVDLDAFLDGDRRRRDLIQAGETLKAERNRSSAQIPVLRREGKDASALMADMKRIAERIRAIDEELAVLESAQQEFLEGLPNLPADDVPAGGKENNQVVSVFGSQPSFGFEPQHHVDLAEKLGLIDYVRGAKLGGSGHWIYRGDGARIEWALLSYFMSEHHKDGYEMILPPHILNWQCGYTAGQFPKFSDEVFQIRGDEGEPDGGKGFTRFLLPTSETALVNLYRDEVIDASQLPLKLYAYSPCYRKEAGSYRAEERGMIRGHQFNKIEMFQYTLPSDSGRALRELVGKASALMEGLGLHHRVSRLAAEDCSASMRETCDIEVWIPSMNIYKEVSSASNAGDYQARRGNIKYRDPETGRLEFVHTLNASGLATSRILPAILEQCQQADGSVEIPAVLRPWMDGQERIAPRA
ncbi:MAG: serine--tRNA ligase [Clostridia bacterium]|nr:serine--tRNA ligase [Clostridia bacterium]